MEGFTLAKRSRENLVLLNMKRKLLTFLYLLFFIATVYSQNFTVTGKVVDASSLQVLEYATIIFSSGGSSNAFGGVTDKKGNFKISVPEGNYTITIEFLSYKSKVFETQEINDDTNLGTIKLSQDIEALDVVTVAVENNNATEIKLNKIIYDVDKDILSNGGTATDILENIPSVSLSADGSLTIRGSAPRILINGRISARSKPEALKNIPASSIQKIEVITTPSVRFSGDSSGGIINIILKKGLDNGFNGSVTGTTTLGEKNIFGAATSLNYRKDKLNIYTNTNYFQREPIANTSINNEYTANGITDGFLNEDRKYTRKTNVFQSTLGLDYYFNDYVSLNIEGTYSYFNGDFTNKNISNYFDSNYLLTQTNERNIITDHKDEVYEIAATYDQYFERENEQLLINFSYSKDIEINNSDLSNRDFFPSYMEYPDEDERIYNNLNLQNTYWYVAYALPINETSLLEFGNESTLGKVKHNYINEIIVNGDFEPNPNTSNLLHYNENWYRFYAQYDQEFEKFSYGIGLSVEFTDLDINLVTTNERNAQKYTDFNPSASFGYTISDTKSISFSYRRGLYRMGYEDLNPFEQRISETTSFKGNINLLPIYGNSFEFSFLNSAKKILAISPSLYYKNYNNWVQYVTYETGEIINGVPKLVTTPINLGSLSRLGAEFIADYNPNDWLNFTSTIDFYYVKQTGVYEYDDVNNDLVILDYNDTSFGGNAKLNTLIKFRKDFNFQALFQYYLPSEAANSKREGYMYMNASMSKDIFKKKATISLIADDIFDSNKTKRTRWTDDVISYSNSQWKEPSILLSFTYRFNQSKKDKKIEFDQKDEEIEY